MIVEFKMIVSGLYTIALGGVVTGLGIIFWNLVLSVSRNTGLSRQLFNFSILGFAFTEAIALFTMMIAFLIMF